MIDERSLTLLCLEKNDRLFRKRQAIRVAKYVEFDIYFCI